MFGLTRYIAKGFVTVAIEVASNIAGIVHKVITDAPTTVEKSAGDSASIALKVAGDITCTVMKIVGTSVATSANVGSDVAITANKIANEASDSLLDMGITSIPSQVLRG